MNKTIIRNDNEFSQSKYLLLLAMIYVVIAAVTSTFIYRFISIGDLLLPGGIFIYPIMYVICDAIAEIYGYKVARLIIWYGIFCNFLFAFCTQLIVHLPAPPHLQYLNDYTHVFSGLLRVDFSSLLGTIVGSFLNIYLLTKWKIVAKGEYFIARSFTSNVFGELIALVIAGMLSLVGKYPMHEVIKIISSDYVIRIIFAFIATVPSSWFVSYLKRREKIDVYSIGTDFNPFKLDINK